jgi:hypothetical protein
MDLSIDSTPQLATAVQLAVQQQVLGGMKADGAQIAQMIATSAPTPAIGSVNGPSQGKNVDAFV